MVREAITDEIWGILKPLLPKPKGRHGKNDRMFLEAVGQELHGEIYQWSLVHG